MADRFYAATEIKHGVREEDGSQDGKYTSKRFKVGDEVKGLSKEDMESLWNAGALERRGSNDDAPAEAESDDNAPKAGDDTGTKESAGSPAPAKSTTSKAQATTKTS
jgi:hypothetical protein